MSYEESIKQRFERIAKLNPKLNAFVELFYEQALKTAKQCDQSDTKGPLHGVPISIKECYQLAGTATTINYTPLRNYRAETTSPLVQRLIDAGAVIVGKTNVPTLLADAQTFGPLYPTANNPYDLTRTPGGSTGGGAAALAAGLVDIELGSDIGGSIRNPAHFCGLYSIKPTENGHAHDGHIPPLPDHDVGLHFMNSTGPLARSATQLKTAYDVLYQPDWQRRFYLPIARPQVTPDSLAGYRFGYIDSFLGLGPGQDVTRALEKTIGDLREKGASVEKITLDPHLARKLLTLWVELFGFVMGQTLSWPVRKLIYWQYSKLLKRSSLPATKALKSGLSLNLKRLSAALKERDEVIAEINRLYAQVDVVISPTSLGPAFPHNHKHESILLDGEAVPYVDYCFPFVMLYNLTGQPVLNVPTGLTESGLPVGLSFAAAHHQEPTLLHLAQLLEAEGYQPVPPKLEV